MEEEQTPKTPRGLTTTGKTDSNYGAIHAEWSFPEFMQFERSIFWYLITSAIGIAFLIYAVVTNNYLFAVSIIIIAIIIFLHHKREPLDVEIKIMEDGIMIDRKFYEWKQLKKFWIIYEPPEVKKLYITSEAFWRPEFSIPLEEQNPIHIRKILLNYIEEDLEKKTESPGDSISRIVKL